MSIVKNLVNFDEIARYEEGVQAFLSGEMDPDLFMSFRLQHGIYGQRQEGVHMVRVKVPGGGMSGAQLAVIADCLADHSEHDVAHVTTRQDFQIHYVPRKFKSSFSACETDCAQGLMHDIGVVAVHKDGRFGFKVLAGGGLGHKPYHAITVEEFVEEKDLLASMEAILTLHNKYSDRKRRARAPNKLLVDKFTPERFLAKYREEHGIEEIRTAQEQKRALIDVREDSFAAIRAALAAVGLGEPKAGDNVVACPGTSTCRLGITSSKAIGAKLSGGPLDLRIRASGCQNGCAQPETGDIGIYGEGKRLHGKLVPHYQMYFGGDGRGDGAIALKGPSVPVVRVEQAIKRVSDNYGAAREGGEGVFSWTRRRGITHIASLIADLQQVTPEQLAEVAHDNGQEEQFKVLQLGGGECAGAAQSLVTANYTEAAPERNYRDAFRLQRDPEKSIECAEQMLRLIGQSELFLAGKQASAELPAMVRELGEALPASDLGSRMHDILAGLEDQRDEFDDLSLKALGELMDEWLLDAAAACPPVKRKEAQTAPVSDLTGFGCPLHYIKARNELRKYPAGEVVDFLFVSGDPSQQVRNSLKSDGHEILAVEEQGTATRIKVRKAPAASASAGG